jgi:hypothetical protein
MYPVLADEAEHCDVNHICSTMKEGAPNPVSNTEQKLNTMLTQICAGHDGEESRKAAQNK